MKQLLSKFLVVLFILTAVSMANSLYGTVTFPASAQPSNYVDNAIVKVYKDQGGTYVYVGQTVASACGYYTYNTGSTGNFKVSVDGTYYIRAINPCGARVAQYNLKGTGYGSVTIRYPEVYVNIPVD
jgi:hypothetical protein